MVKSDEHEAEAAAIAQSKKEFASEAGHGDRK
jgi:hypothetical protein